MQSVASPPAEIDVYEPLDTGLLADLASVEELTYGRFQSLTELIKAAHRHFDGQDWIPAQEPGFKSKSIYHAQDAKWRALGKMVLDKIDPDVSVRVSRRVSNFYLTDAKPYSLSESNTFPSQVRNIVHEKTKKFRDCRYSMIDGRMRCVARGCKHCVPLCNQAIVFTSAGRDIFVEHVPDVEIKSSCLNQSMMDSMIEIIPGLGFAREDVDPSIHDHLSVTEPPSVRWDNEGTSHLPFPLVTYFSNFMSYQKAACQDDDFTYNHPYYEEFLARGGEYCIQAVFLCAMEWHMTHANSGTVTDDWAKKPDYLGSKTLVELAIRGWINQKGIKLPSWAWDLRAGRNIDYISGTEYGYKGNGMDLFEHCHAELQAQAKARGKLDIPVKDVVVPRHFAPFIERPGRPHLLTDAAMTSGITRRVFHCLSHMIFHSNTSDVQHFDMLVAASNAVMGEYPGGNGKAVSKALLPWGRAFAAYPRMVHGVPISVPLEPGPLTDLAIHEPAMVKDLQAYAMVRKTLHDDWDHLTWNGEVSDSDWDALLSDAVQNAPEPMREALTALGDHHKARDVPAGRSDVMRIISFTLGAGVYDGFQWATSTALPITSHASAAQRRYRESVNVNGVQVHLDNPTTADAPYQTTILQVIINDMLKIPETFRSIQRRIPSIITSSSGGADSVKLLYDVRSVISDSVQHTGSTDVKVSTNMKSTSMPLLAGHFLPESPVQYYKTIIERQYETTPAPPGNFGTRHTAGKGPRPIFNVSILDQIYLSPFNDAIKRWMQTESDLGADQANFNYQPLITTGADVQDMIQNIHGSVAGCWNPNILNLAEDASALDQHITQADRVLITDILEGYASQVDGYAFGIDGPASDGPYSEVLKHVFLLRNKWWFRVKINGAPDQIVEICSMPSGDLVTSVLDSLKTTAMQLHMGNVEHQLPSGRSSVKHLGGTKIQIQGDDVAAIFDIEPTDCVECIKARSGAAAYCNMALDTITKSWSGSTVSHFLQIAFIYGRKVTRFMALDHERSTEYDSTQMGSFIDKYVKLCTRGGNVETSTMLINMLLMMGSSESAFGDKYEHDIATMLQPGGIVNRMPIGFPSPSSLLYMSINARRFGMDQPMAPPLVTESDFDMGKRMDESAPNQKVKGMVANARLAKGPEKQDGSHLYTVDELINDTQNAIIKPEIVPDSRAAEASMEAWRRDGLTDTNNRFYLSNAARGLFRRGLGIWMKNRSMYQRQLFKEAQIRSGRYSGKTIMPTTAARVSLFIGGNKVPIKFDYESKLVMVRTRSGYALYRGRNYIRAYAPQWHCYNDLDGAAPDILSVFGVSSDRRDTVTRKNAMAVFNIPGRADISGEEIAMELVRHPHYTRRTLALAMGMTASQWGKAEGHLNNLSLLQTLSDVDSYSSQFDAMTSLNYEKIQQLMMELAIEGIVLDDIDPTALRVLSRAFSNLIYEDANLIFFCNNKESRIVFRVPRITLDADHL
jgi:hypothetical protein